MKYALQHLNASEKILLQYKGEVPFHLFLKKYFSANKKFGSRDRKVIASMCYNYFRLGKAYRDRSIEEQVITGSFLSGDDPGILQARPDLYPYIEKSLEEKLSFVSSPGTFRDIFPYGDELSEGIDHEKFSRSFLIQPDLFLRIRPGNHKKVISKLTDAAIPFNFIGEDCITLPNATKIDSIIELDKEAVVQDYNSQRTGELLPIGNWQLAIANRQQAMGNTQQSLKDSQPATGNLQPATSNLPPATLWDCCAASGGKSIMAYDINRNLHLTVSDKRESILQNLHKRFKRAGIRNYNSFITDLATGNQKPVTGNFDVIICDAPCTGSGTWSRTPEQLFYFDKTSIAEYAALQKKIVSNAVDKLRKGGSLLYITCSVFKQENEDAVKYINEELKLQTVRTELLKGYEMRADTLFVALFVRG